MEKVEIGSRIAQLRESKKLSKSALAEAIEVTQKSIHNFETGKSLPNTEAFFKLSKFFGVSLDYLMGNETSLQSKTLLLMSEKGGVGKSTISLGLATYFGAEGKRVLLIDTDPQKTITVICNMYAEHGALPFVHEYFDFSSQHEFDEPTDRFRKHFEELKNSGRYDLILIDSPGDLKRIREQSVVMKIADLALIPIEASQFSIVTMGNTLTFVDSVQKVKAYENGSLKILSVANKVDRTKESEHIFELSGMNNMQMMKSPLRHLAVYKRMSPLIPLTNEDFIDFVTELKAEIYG